MTGISSKFSFGGGEGICHSSVAPPQGLSPAFSPLKSPWKRLVNIEINPAMTDAPEAINQEPYGSGWLAVIEATQWEADRARLLDAQAYFAKMKAEAEEETQKL